MDDHPTSRALHRKKKSGTKPSPSSRARIVKPCTERSSQRKSKNASNENSIDPPPANRVRVPCDEDPCLLEDELTGMGCPALGDSDQCPSCGSWMDYACDDMFICSVCE